MDTNTALYQAIFGLYRRAVVDYVRARFRDRYGHQHEQRFNRLYRRISRRKTPRFKPPELPPPVDVYDQLDLSEFSTLFTNAPDVLVPGWDGSRTSQRLLDRLVELMRVVVDFRNGIAHPGDTNIGRWQGLIGLAEAYQVLLYLRSAESDLLLRMIESLVSTPGSTHEKPSSSHATAHPTRRGRYPLRSPGHGEARWNKVPARDDEFVGREGELSRLLEAYRNGRRLVLITGDGGVGKTRLAEEFVRRSAAAICDRHLFVTLEHIHDATMVTNAILACLGRDLAHRGDPIAEIARELDGPPTLLVLDNFEHVLVAREFLPPLIRSCHLLKILVTSRRRLNIREQEIRLRPLGVPRFDETGSLEHLEDRSPAVQLLMRRARAAGVAISAADGEAVLGLCRKLEGVPLAIEQIVPHLRGRRPEEVLADLDQLLNRAQAGVADRHRTIFASIHYTYTHLSEQDRDLLRVLGVFAPGAEIDDVRSVAMAMGMDPVVVRDSIASLIDWNLVRRSRDDRLWWSGLVERYVRDRIHGWSGYRAASDAHADHYTNKINAGILSIVDINAQNLHKAVRWATEQAADDPVRLVRLLRRLPIFRMVRGASEWIGHQSTEVVAAWNALQGLSNGVSEGMLADVAIARAEMAVLEEDDPYTAERYLDQLAHDAERPDRISELLWICYFELIFGDNDEDRKQWIVEFACEWVKETGNPEQIAWWNKRLGERSFHFKDDEELEEAIDDLKVYRDALADASDDLDDPEDNRLYACVLLRARDWQHRQEVDEEPSFYAMSDPVSDELCVAKASFKTALDAALEGGHGEMARDVAIRLGEVERLLCEWDEALHDLLRVAGSEVKEKDRSWFDRVLFPLAVRLCLRMPPNVWEYVLKKERVGCGWVVREAGLGLVAKGKYSAGIRVLAAADAIANESVARRTEGWRKAVAALDPVTVTLAVQEGAEMTLLDALIYAFDQLHGQETP